MQETYFIHKVIHTTSYDNDQEHVSHKRSNSGYWAAFWQMLAGGVNYQTAESSKHTLRAKVGRASLLTKSVQITFKWL